MNKIISLSKVFTKEYVKNLKIFKQEKNGSNKKSLLFWIIVIIIIALTYLSHEVIDFLVQARSTTNIFELLYGDYGNIFAFSNINDSN